MTARLQWKRESVLRQQQLAVYVADYVKVSGHRGNERVWSSKSHIYTDCTVVSSGALSC